MLLISYFLLYIICLFSITLLVKGFLRGAINAYYFIIPVLIIFYILPEVLDFLVGTKFIGPSSTYVMREALLDEKTTIFYNIYISIILVLFSYLMVKSSSIGTENLKNQIYRFSILFKKYKYLYWALIFIPIILVFYTGSLDFYMDYTDRNRYEGPAVQGVISKLVLASTLLSTLANLYYIKSINNNNSFKYLIPIFFISILLLINFYLHGKRSIVVVFFMVQIAILFISKAVSRRKLSLIAVIFLLLTAVFMKLYGKNIESGSSLLEVITNLRVDFSRDYGVKFVIYHELFNNNSVLPFKGASYLFLLTFFIPRSIYPEKPYPYAVYFTNSAFGNFGNDYLYGWGLTTSFLSESISNLGWFGLFAFPVFYILLIRYISNINSIFTHLLTYLVLVLLLLIQPIAFMVLILLLILFLLKRNKKVVWKRI
ncbi:hypothetical protein [Psychrobacter sp. Ps6]|uniref:hypothetical protein n=1 Tax=Psychrobacter sp. Ps6 TaxID=2790960 RepID=UPI001EDE8CAD|nr:hypothetical protein [Psychrobacter sp. Ps6]MCG3879590.1 oligosaccharide repeat unit polymerase [Psychrobacter sp. Ps6]